MSDDTRSFFPIYIKSAPGQTGQNSAGTVVAASNAAAVASTVFSGVNGNNNFQQIQVANKTSVWVHVNFGVLLGGTTVRAAVITDYPVAPGGVAVVSVDGEVNAASIFADGAPSGSTSVVFTRGQGI